MFDYCLKFASPAEAKTVLFDEEKPKYDAIDLIGEINGADFHVNVRHTAEAPELDAYAVFPVTPARVWF